MYINLSGLNILVTGASRGIGKAIATKLAEAGARIAIHYHKNANEAENLAQVLGNGSKAYQADFSKPEDPAKLFDRIILEMDSIEVIINNAGLAIASDTLATDDIWMKDWNETMQVNLHAPALICKKAIQKFQETKSQGRIINIASRAAFRGEEAAFVSYAASKAGLVALTKSIAKTYGKIGIKAFAIAPGFVRTDMSQQYIQKHGEGIAKDDLALNRLTEPKDIAPLVTFIASGLADHATGSVFDINAGSYLH